MKVKACLIKYSKLMSNGNTETQLPTSIPRPVSIIVHIMRIAQVKWNQCNFYFTKWMWKQVRLWSYVCVF